MQPHKHEWINAVPANNLDGNAHTCVNHSGPDAQRSKKNSKALKKRSDMS